MAPRDKTAVVQLKTRMREPLRARLEVGAKQRGVSLNTEIVDRLEQSFAKEDAFDGPEMLNMARLMATAFIRGGQNLAHARSHPKWSPGQWMNDPECFRAAAHAVAKALAAAQPVSYESADQQDFMDLFVQMAARGDATLAQPNSKIQRAKGRKIIKDTEMKEPSAKRPARRS